MSEFQTALKEALEVMAFPYTQDMLERAQGYYCALVEVNEHLNLTRITEPREAAQRHFAEAARLLGACSIPIGARVLDVGTGGGFPGVALAIFRPDLDVALLDATAKKIAFVAQTCTALGIKVTTVAGRAEALARKAGWREGFDVVTAKAVAALPVLLELCAPFAKPGAVIAAYKGVKAKEELVRRKTAMQALHLVSRETIAFEGQAILLFEKRAVTDAQYPREYRKIKAKPL